MTMTLLLYWFPIFLGVAVGTSLLGGLPRPRGVVLAISCALFWMALVQSHLAAPFWQSGGLMLSTLAGAGAIALLGICGPETAPANAVRAALRPAPPIASTAIHSAAAEDSSTISVAAVQQFDAWLDAHRHCDDPWADFDEFIRGLIYQWVGGTHVRTYRVLDSGEQLLPLHEIGPEELAEGVSARKGVIGYVATTGRSFLAGDATQGDLIAHLVGGGEAPALGIGETVDMPAPAWCFAVTRHSARIGVVVVGALGARSWAVDARRESLAHPERTPREHLRLAEGLVAHFWNALLDVDRGRAALTTDPGSGVLTRKAFFEMGHEALGAAYRDGEPVAVAIVALEGVRALDDDGRWDAADDVRSAVSAMLMKRLRADDRIGRFDDSRFVLLLRRVDSELAQLIVRELIGQLAATMRVRKPHGEEVMLRCGLAGTGVRVESAEPAPPTLRDLVSAAVEACGEARRTSTLMASDLSVRRRAAPRPA